VDGQLWPGVVCAVRGPVHAAAQGEEVVSRRPTRRIAGSRLERSGDVGVALLGLVKTGIGVSSDPASTGRSLFVNHRDH